MSLATLLSPFDVSTFLDEYWTRSALYIEGRCDKFRGLFGWHALNHVLNAGVIRPPDLRMARDGVVVPAGELAHDPGGTFERLVDPRKVIAQCRKGTTLIVDNLNRYSATVRELTADLSSTLGEYSQTNLYCSWPGVAGFALHYDWHEAIVLQIEGRKRWKVFRPTFPFPLRSYRPDHVKPTEPPYCDVALKPGDVLYLPRGHWHEALAEQEASIHLTVSVPCRTGLSFVSWLTERLRHTPEWRANLPLLLVNEDGRSSHERFTASVAELISALGRVLEEPDLADQYLMALVAAERPVRPYDLPLHVVGGRKVAPDTRFERPKYQRVFVRNTSSAGQLVVTIGGHALKWPPRLRRLAEAIFSKLAFCGADLLRECPDLTWGEVEPVLERLVHARIVLPVDEDHVAGRTWTSGTTRPLAAEGDVLPGGRSSGWPVAQPVGTASAGPMPVEAMGHRGEG